MKRNALLFFALFICLLCLYSCENEQNNQFDDPKNDSQTEDAQPAFEELVSDGQDDHEIDPQTEIAEPAFEEPSSDEQDELLVEEPVSEKIFGVSKEVYEMYGESVINPDEDDYSYIRINFDESKEISGYIELGIGFASDEYTEYIDSNGAVYSELPINSKIAFIRDWDKVNIPYPEGVDYIYGSPYDSSLLKFIKGDKYGYLNTDGEIVIEAQFYMANNFSDGLAAVCREEGGCLEYINEYGQTVLKLEDVDGYHNIFQMTVEEPSCDFFDGVALIYGGNENFCIDKEGNRLNVKNPCGMHKQGRIAFWDVETGLYGFADKEGNIVIPAIYSHVYDFLQSGIAHVSSTEKYYQSEEFCAFEIVEGNYRGFIDTQGNIVIPIEYEQPYWLMGMKGFWESFESYGIVSVYKQGYVYYYRYDGTLLGKKPRMATIRYEGEYYKINVAEYWEWINAGKPVG